MARLSTSRGVLLLLRPGSFGSPYLSTRPLAVVVLDLDDFKAVNDLRGHAAGDEVLIVAGQTLRALVGPEAPIGRLGADEFAVAVSGIGSDQLLSSLPAALEGQIVASVGTAVLTVDDATPKALLATADRALEERKAARKQLGQMAAR